MDDLKRWRRDLHQIPELGLEETQTTAYLKAELEKMAGMYQMETEQLRNRTLCLY
ncbi:hypothetical protein [Catenibacterium sp.]|uniref:hypothetical protein n=1 Tax=Catenibacterium sp. TaxID=2049022 RepID=UPI003FD8E90D